MLVTPTSIWKESIECSFSHRHLGNNIKRNVIKNGRYD